VRELPSVSIIRDWEMVYPDRSFWTGKRVCVTGGTGFLGYHIACQLLEAKAVVRIAGLTPRPRHPVHHAAQFERHFGDIRDLSFVKRAVAGCSVVFHAAGNVCTWGAGLSTMREVHLAGTHNVLASVSPWTRVVHTSSAVTAGASERPQPLREDSPFNLDTEEIDYVHSKRASEEFALEAARRGQDVVIVNPGFLVGPEDYCDSVLGRLCRRFWKGQLLLAPGGGMSLADVRDVAAGHLLAAKHGHAGRRYILAGENRTIRDFMMLLADTARLSPRWLPQFNYRALRLLAALSESRALLTGNEPHPSRQQALLSRYFWYYDSTRARQELGYQWRPLAQSIKDAFAWHRSLRPLLLRRPNRWWMRPAA
jgi:dihydroflavonol-4-reductase